MPILILLAGCQAQANRSPDVRSDGGDQPSEAASGVSVAVAFDTIIAAQTSGIETPIRKVVYDRESWLQVWTRIVGGEAASRPAPSVDFDRDMLIVVGLGARRTGGHAIRVESIVDEGDWIAVAVETVEPGTACLVTQAFTAPVEVVRFQRSSGEIRFVERTVVREC